MKTLLTTIMFLVFWTTVYGQVAYENIDIKTNNNYQYVATNNTPANEKYSRVRKWLEEYIPDFKNTIIVDYPQAFQVEFRPEIEYDNSETKTHYLVANICVECRDDKFEVKLKEINRKTLTSTCNYLTLPNKIYKTRQYNANEEIKQFDRYKELSSKKNLTSDETKALKELKRYANVTKEKIIEKEMKQYTDLQKAIARLIEGIEKAIKGKKRK